MICLPKKYFQKKKKKLLEAIMTNLSDVNIIIYIIYKFPQEQPRADSGN